jgi:hypothetical protein
MIDIDRRLIFFTCIIAIIALIIAFHKASKARGVKGPMGPKGATGAIGKDGKKGNDGNQGNPGTDGKDGKDGKKGNDGKQGNPGTDGKDGKKGNDGNQGNPGTDGKDGKDGKKGNDGKQGNPGTDGKDGKDGKKGNDGKQGNPGTDGKDGKKGDDGKQGNPGTDGKDGKQGIDGKDGKQGLKGDKGFMGDQGPPGLDALDIISTQYNNGSCSCAQYCASNWDGEVTKARPSWNGAFAVMALNNVGKPLSINDTTNYTDKTTCLCAEGPRFAEKTSTCSNVNLTKQWENIIVKYGDHIRLRHVYSNKYLRSCGTNSVDASSSKTDATIWRFINDSGPISYNYTVILDNAENGRQLFIQDKTTYTKNCQQSKGISRLLGATSNAALIKDFPNLFYMIPSGASGAIKLSYDMPFKMKNKLYKEYMTVCGQSSCKADNSSVFSCVESSPYYYTQSDWVIEKA